MCKVEILLNFLFPPFCICCHAPSIGHLFCQECWNECALIDPVERCHHCFTEIEEPLLCVECQSAPRFPIPMAFLFERIEPAFLLTKRIKRYPEAIGSFFWIQWERLNWSVPDCILPLSGMKPVAHVLSSFMNCPMLPAFSSLIYDVAMVEEESVLLLLASDREAEDLREVIYELGTTFPKKVYLLAMY